MSKKPECAGQLAFIKTLFLRMNKVKCFVYQPLKPVFKWLSGLSSLPLKNTTSLENYKI
jgi:hypothetical protein